MIAWKELQTRRANEAEIRGWYAKQPDAGVIIICGRLSGIAVADIDPRNGGDRELANRFAGPIAETPSGGLHLYFADDTIPKLPALLPGLDLQGEGSYVIAPPSLHPNGGRYQWAPGHALGEVPLPPLPAWIRQLIRGRERRAGASPVPAADLPRDVGHILAQLQAVRRVAGGRIARCPGHDDREPSLSIGVGRDGQILLHCFAGCPFKQIVAAIEAVPV